MADKESNKNLITLTDKQELGRRMLMEKNTFNSIMFDGGSRAGKTFLILICLIMFCINYPGLRVLIARLRFAHARASIWEQSLLPLLKKMRIRHHIDKSMFIVKIGLSEIWLGGLDNKDRTDKVLGQEYGIVFLNEAVEIPPSSRDVILTRLAQNIEGLINFIIYDCNPRQPTHYLFKEFYGEKRTIDNGVLKFLPEDNIENLPPGYIDKILSKLPPDKKARFLLGEWCYLPGAVYHNVNEGCLIDCEQNIYHFYDDVAVGIDWGLHTACVIWGFKRVRNKIQAYCIFEIIILNGTTDELIVELDKFEGIKLEGHMLYCDHEPDRIMKLQAAGYMAKNAYKDVASGDDSVNECELFFDKTYSKYTFDSMLNLTHPPDPSGEGFIYGKHVKENDHEADGSRYAINGWMIDNRVKEGGHYILGEVG